MMTELLKGLAVIGLWSLFYWGAVVPLSNPDSRFYDWWIKRLDKEFDKEDGE
jgi:hypothetical protein